MNQQSNKLGIREYVALALLMVGTKLSDDTPSVLYYHLKNAAWMVPVISGMIMLIPLFLLMKTISLYQGKNLFEVMDKVFGKFISFVLCFFLFLLGSFSFVVDSRSYSNIISTMYFTNTPPFIIYLMLIVVCAYGARKGIQYIGSVAWLMIFYIKVSLAIIFILALKEGVFDSIFPIWGPGKLEIAKQSVLKTSLYGDFFFLALIVPFMNSVKDFRKGTWITLCFLIVEITFALLIYILMFDYMTISILSYPFHESIRYISLGDFLTNIETFFFPIWLAATFIRFSAYLYLGSFMFGQLFKIKDTQYIVPILASVYLLFGLFPQTPAFTTYVLRQGALNFASPMVISFPILLWLVALIRGEFKHAKNKNSM